jgi:hypothetical protein
MSKKNLMVHYASYYIYYREAHCFKRCLCKVLDSFQNVRSREGSHLFVLLTVESSLIK